MGRAQRIKEKYLISGVVVGSDNKKTVLAFLGDYGMLPGGFNH